VRASRVDQPCSLFTPGELAFGREEEGFLLVEEGVCQLPKDWVRALCGAGLGDRCAGAEGVVDQKTTFPRLAASSTNRFGAIRGDRQAARSLG
jgi:hypothetical protein